MIIPMWAFAVRALLFCILLTVLSACGSVRPVSTTVVQGACHIPEKLDYEATGPVPLQSADTPLAKHLADDVKERVAHRRLADDYNALRGHIRGC